MPISGDYTGLGQAPTVVAAQAITQSTVRVFFSEAMLNESQLLTPGFYIFTTADAPRVATVIAPGAAIGPTFVDITLDGNLTPGTNNYTITVSTIGPRDVAGNLIDPAGDDAVFGFGASGQLSVSVQPPVVHEDGGYALTLITNDPFPLGTYRLRCGPSVNASSTICYSGVSGREDKIVATARTVRVDIAGTTNGEYSVHVNGRSCSFVASGHTAAQIRDGLIVAINGAHVGVTASVFDADSLLLTVDTLGTVLDVQVSGPATNITATITSTVMFCASVVLAVGGPYSFHITSIADGTTYTTVPVLSALPREYRSGTFAIRRLLPPMLDVGPRNLKQV